MKILAILPLTVVLISGCGTTERISKQDVVIVDKGSYQGVDTINTNTTDSVNAIDAIEREQANLKWRDSNERANTPLMPTVEREAIVKMLKAQGVNFTLYFDYDSARINPEDIQEIKAHLQFMQENPEVKLRLEGNTDQRGTREYNLALGENRAMGVKLLMQNVASRIEVVSYGEEKPAQDFDDEFSWQKNRRVEFIYQ